LLAICDANYRLVFVDVGAYGKSSDSTVFLESAFLKQLVEGKIKFPKSRPLPGQNVDRPFIIVGDEAFSLSEKIMRPYSGHFLSLKKRIFNYRLSRARRFIECTFGIMANKWRILHRAMDVCLETAQLITQMCCLLHNFVRERENFVDFDSEADDVSWPWPEMQRGTGNQAQVGRLVNGIRNTFADYFVSEEGKVPWQLEKNSKVATDIFLYGTNIRKKERRKNKSSYQNCNSISWYKSEKLTILHCLLFFSPNFVFFKKNAFASVSCNQQECTPAHRVTCPQFYFVKAEMDVFF